MALTREQKSAGMAWLNSLPGKKGRDIPADIHDTLRQVADGITMPVWGRPATPQQLQDLHDAGAHTPAEIHALMAQLPHPQAPDLTLGEYQQYSDGYQVYKEHKGGRM